MKRGEIWWADLPEPRGSEPGYRRPVLIVQADSFNESRIQTVLIAAISSNTALAGAPGNVLLAKGSAGLKLDSVVNVSQITTLDRRYLLERAGALSAKTAARIDTGLRMVLEL